MAEKTKRWTPEAREAQAKGIKTWQPWKRNASPPPPAHQALSTAIANFLHHQPDELEPEST